MMTTPKVTRVEVHDDYALLLTFEGGEQRVFDATPYLDKGIFTELKSPHYFEKVRLSFGSVAWPNEQDFSRDTLYLRSREMQKPVSM